MKTFTQEKGIFSIELPLDWEYVEPMKSDHIVYTFQRYDKDIGTFQISYVKNPKKIKEIIKGKKILKNKHTDINYKIAENFIKSDDFFDTIQWFIIVENYLFLITFIYDYKRRNEKMIQEEIQKARFAVSTLRYIHPKFREKKLTWDRFGKFLTGIYASIDLSDKAAKKGAFIEGVILFANQIDALLRLAIILKRQIINNNNEIDKKLLFQDTGDKPIMERKIYKLAFDEDIINSNTFNELNELYNERNKVVHRYIITDIKTEDVLNIAIKYDSLKTKIIEIVEDLEKEQVRRRKGMTGTGEDTITEDLHKNEIDRIIFSIKDKHGGIDWGREEE